MTYIYKAEGYAYDAKEVGIDRGCGEDKIEKDIAVITSRGTVVLAKFRCKASEYEAAFYVNCIQILQKQMIYGPRYKGSSSYWTRLSFDTNQAGFSMEVLGEFKQESSMLNNTYSFVNYNTSIEAHFLIPYELYQHVGVFKAVEALEKLIQHKANLAGSDVAGSADRYRGFLMSNFGNGIELSELHVDSELHRLETGSNPTIYYTLSVEISPCQH